MVAYSFHFRSGVGQLGNHKVRSQLSETHRMGSSLILRDVNWSGSMCKRLRIKLHLSPCEQVIWSATEVGGESYMDGPPFLEFTAMMVEDSVHTGAVSPDIVLGMIHSQTVNWVLEVEALSSFGQVEVLNYANVCIELI